MVLCHHAGGVWYDGQRDGTSPPREIGPLQGPNLTLTGPRSPSAWNLHPSPKECCIFTAHTASPPGMMAYVATPGLW